MVKCNNCGAEVVGSDFCFNCGEKVEKFESDSELIEEYFEKNNVKYRWISIDDELEL